MTKQNTCLIEPVAIQRQKINQNLWKPLKIYEKPLNTYEHRWKIIENLENHWKSMNNCWKSVTTYESRWSTNENVWKPVNPAQARPVPHMHTYPHPRANSTHSTPTGARCIVLVINPVLWSKWVSKCLKKVWNSVNPAHVRPLPDMHTYPHPEQTPQAVRPWARASLR